MHLEARQKAPLALNSLHLPLSPVSVGNDTLKTFALTDLLWTSFSGHKQGKK